MDGINASAPPPRRERERRRVGGTGFRRFSAKATRRRFSPRYKLSVVERADACETPGKIGELHEARVVVQFASAGVAQGGAGGIAGGAGRGGASRSPRWTMGPRRRWLV